jgi:CRP-like cAMP-binding protein
LTRKVGDMALTKLRDHGFTQGLTEEQLASLASMAQEVTFQENELILVDGQRSTSFYLVTRGSVAVELRTGSFAVCVQALGPGQAFGWSALLNDQDTLFQVRAREKTTALMLKGSDLQDLCKIDTSFAAAILQRTLQLVAGRVKATEIRFAEMCGVKL